jgi:hypothetical protein
MVSMVIYLRIQFLKERTTIQSIINTRMITLNVFSCVSYLQEIVIGERIGTTCDQLTPI